MRKLKIYLDTSVLNFLFADDAPEKKEVTEEFFRNFVKKNVYDVYISPVVIDEISKTKDEMKRLQRLKVIKDYKLTIIDIEEYAQDINRLAQKYIYEKIIPEKKFEDALHIAISVLFEMDILLSWNYKHLANINKELLIYSVNMKEGYLNKMRMTNPMEVIYDERN